MIGLMVGTSTLAIGLAWGAVSLHGATRTLDAPAAAVRDTTEDIAGTALKSGTVYCTRPGDTLYAIARRHGTTVAAIAAANGIGNVNLIVAGRCLKIPAGGTGGVIGKPTGPGCTAMAPPGNVPFVFVTSPQIGAQVQPGFMVTGCANVFEAVVEWKLMDSQGAQIGQGNTLATCGTGCVGSFTFTVPFTTASPQVGSLEVYHTSAATGAPVYVNTIPLVLLP